MTSKVRLFADDCVIYRKVVSIEDAYNLQNDLNILRKWCQDWQMEVNVSKTKILSITTKQTPITNHYTLNEKQVENVLNFKYLGVHLTSDLSWNLHVDTVPSNAYKTLGFIRRNLYFANSDTKLLAYNTLVRSKLDYASQLWNPHQVYLINKIESLQNKSARFITKIYSRTSSINEIKKSLNLPSLQSRRLYSLLSLFHDLYHNHSQLCALINLLNLLIEYLLVWTTNSN